MGRVRQRDHACDSASDSPMSRHACNSGTGTSLLWNLPGATIEVVRPSSPFHCGVRMKIRVLIVDDEPIARRGIRRYLAKRNDIEVIGEAANGINAVEQINELHPDIVFLDVQMPDLDGFGVIEN